MEILDYHCYVEIFKYLTFAGQCAAVSVWPGCLKCVWKEKYRNISHNYWTDHQQILRNDEYFKHFVSSIYETIFELAITVTARQYEILKCEMIQSVAENQFSEAVLFDMRIRATNMTYADEDIELLTKKFPILQSLQLNDVSGPFTGKYIANWEELEYISLHKASSLQPQYIREIFEKLSNLKSVEFGFLRTELLDALNPKHFAKFRKIAISSNQMGKFITSPDSDLSCLKDFNIDCDAKFGPDGMLVYSSNIIKTPNVEKLTIQHGARAIKLLLIPCVPQLSALREIYLINCCISTKSDLQDLLQISKQVTLIRMERCTAEFGKIIIQVDPIVEYRQTTLKFIYNAIGFVPVQIRNINNPYVQLAPEVVALKFDSEKPLFIHREARQISD